MEEERHNTQLYDKIKWFNYFGFLINPLLMNLVKKLKPLIAIILIKIESCGEIQKYLKINNKEEELSGLETTRFSL